MRTLSWLGLSLASLLAGPEMRFEGKSVNSEERSQLRIEREKKAAASLGLAFESGRWVIPRDRFGAGDGNANGREGGGPKTAKGGPPPSLEAIAQLANLSVETYDTLHCRIGGNVDRTRLRDLGQAAEKAWVAFQKMQFGETGGGLGSLDASFAAEDGGRFLLLWSRDRAGAQRLRNALQGRRADVVVVSEEGITKPQALAEAMHRFAHVLLSRFRFEGKDLPDWFDEGFACLMDLRAGAAAPYSCRAPASVSFAENGPEMGKGDWRQSVQSLMQQRKLRPLKVLVGLGLEEMSADDVLQSMSLVEYLGKRASLPKLEESLRAASPAAGVPFPRGVDAVRPHEIALQSAIGTAQWDAIESAWKAMAGLPR